MEGEEWSQPYERGGTIDPNLLLAAAGGGASMFLLAGLDDVCGLSFTSFERSSTPLLATWGGSALLSFPGETYHGDCRVCTENGTPVSADFCHPLCAGGSEFGGEAYQQVIEAARLGDVRALLAAATTVPSTVQINQPRRSIQVLNCQSTVVANLPLEEFYTEAVGALGMARSTSP